MCVHLFRMRSFLILALAYLMLLQIPLVSAYDDDGVHDEVHNVIIIGWDGALRDDVYQMLNRGELPNLKALIDEGGLVNITVIDHHTDTMPGWAQVLTGYRWWRIGIYSNKIFFHFAIPDGYTVFERVKAYFGNERVYTAMITGKERPIVQPKAALPNQTGFPYHNALPEIDEFYPMGAPANETGPKMLQALDNWRKSGREFFFGFFQFREPDTEGHAYGEGSSEYLEAIRTCDLWTGRIINKLKSMGVYNNTFIYVTTDHGFNRGTNRHRNAPWSWLATNDPRVKRNEDKSWCDLVDIAPTALYGMGVNLSEINPPLDGYPLQEDLPRVIEWYRKIIFEDSELPTVSITYPEDGAVITTEKPTVNIEFSASDENLIVVVLVIDDELKEIYELCKKGNWTQNAITELDASYEWNIQDVFEGTHTITVYAFDEGPNPLPPESGLGEWPKEGIPVKSQITVTIKRIRSIQPLLTIIVVLTIMAVACLVSYFLVKLVKKR